MEQNLGRWIQRRRKSLDLTQKQLADRVGCALDTIRKIEASARRPSRQVAERLATALELQADERDAFIRLARTSLPPDELPPAQAAAPATLTAALPRGTVSLLLAALGGQRQTELERERLRGALAAAARARGGVVVRSAGPMFGAAFPGAVDAVLAAAAAQRALSAEPGGDGHAHVTVHTGVAEPHDGGYAGETVARAEEILAAARGGEALVSRITRELVAGQLPEGVELRELGGRAVAGAPADGQIFLLAQPGLARSAAAAPAGGLPGHLSSMVNRTQELADLRLLLRQGRRLITLTGLGGVGKTRLALELATRVAGDYADGARFVDLSEVRDPHHIGAQVAQAVGLIHVSEEDAEQRLQAWLRDRRLLLLLDNAEQLAEAPRQFVRWLDAAPGLALLVTSRAPLGLRGEQEYLVSPLELPAELAPLTPAEIAQNDAVRLFVARAQEIKPGFALAPDSAADVVEICRLVDGLPLAIELAAARVRLFSPRQLLDRLRRLGLMQVLTEGRRDMPARQATLDAMVSWSFDLLRPAERRLLARLAVLVSSWTVEALEAIGGEERVLELLERLVAHSLVRQVAGAGGQPRFTLLRTISEYALRRLRESGEEPAVRRRHAAYYFGVAAGARASYDAGAVDAFMPVHRELENLRAALGWAVESGMLREAAETIVSLTPFWFSRMPVTIEWMDATLARAGELPTALRASLLSLAGSLSWEAFRSPTHARQLLETALAVKRADGDLAGVAAALTGLAQIAVAAGELDRALIDSYLAESLALRRRLGDDAGVAETLSLQGRFAALAGNYGHAEALMREALAIRRVIGAPLGIAVALVYIGWLALQMGDYRRMRAISAERGELERAMGNPQGIADCALWEGVAALWLGDVAAARALVEGSLEQLRALNDPRNLPHILDICAHAAALGGDVPAALAYQAERARVLDLLDARRGLAWTDVHLGRIALDGGRLPDAARCGLRALEVLSSPRDPYGPTHLFDYFAPRSGAPGFALALELAAAVALAGGRAGDSARLSGAARRLRADEWLAFAFPDERRQVEQTVAGARAALGPEALAGALAEGEGMGLDRALALAGAALVAAGG